MSKLYIYDKTSSIDVKQANGRFSGGSGIHTIGASSVADLQSKMDALLAMGQTFERVLFQTHGNSGSIFFNHEAIDSVKISNFVKYCLLFPNRTKVYFDGCNVGEGKQGWAFLAAAGQALALRRVAVLVARVLARERRQPVERAAGSPASERAEPQLLPAAADALVEQPAPDPGRVQQQIPARRAQHSPLPREQVEGEELAAARVDHVVDDRVVAERGPAEAASRAGVGDGAYRRRIRERQGPKLLLAARKPCAEDEPALGDPELLGSGERELEDRLERVGRGHRDRLAVSPRDVGAAHRRVRARELDALPVTEQEAADARLVPDEIRVGRDRVAARGRDRRRGACLPGDERHEEHSDGGPTRVQHFTFVS